MVDCHHGVDCQDEGCSGFEDDCVEFRPGPPVRIVLPRVGESVAAEAVCIGLIGSTHLPVARDRDGKCFVCTPRTEHPETDCHCTPYKGVHTYQDSTCDRAREDEDFEFPAEPPVREVPQTLPQVTAAYRVIYATEGGTLHAIDVPYGVNASVIDGQLRLWHAGTPILAIQANITSVEETPQ